MAAQKAEIFSHLASKSLGPTQSWLDSFFSSLRTLPPLRALQQTALFRLLASDFTQSLQSSPTSVFPQNIHDANVQERRLAGPIPCQLIDIEDIGSSRWNQLEAIEAAERGETTKGREIIRAVPGEDNDSNNLNPREQEVKSSGPHKFVLQDAKGTSAYGFELKSIDGFGLGMNIGAKVVLRDVLVARGVLLLEPRNVTMLGGKIDGLHKAWRDGRKESLKTACGVEPT